MHANLATNSAVWYNLGLPGGGGGGGESSSESELLSAACLVSMIRTWIFFRRFLRKCKKKIVLLLDYKVRDRVNKVDGWREGCRTNFHKWISTKKTKHGLWNMIFVEKCNKSSCMSNVRFISYSKCSIWCRILKFSLNFGSLFTFCYLDGANSIKTDSDICNLWTGQ